MVCSGVLCHINWLSVVVATLAIFIAGSLWYSPVLFSKTWLIELKVEKKEINKNAMLRIFILAFVLEFIAVIGLAVLIGKNSTVLHGLITGLFVAIVWSATSLGIIYLFSQRSLKLFLIDAGYYLVAFAIAGAILGAW